MVRQDEAIADAGTTLLPAGAKAAPSWRTELESAGIVMIRVAAKMCARTNLGLSLANNRRSKFNQRAPFEELTVGATSCKAFVDHGIA